ncbi:MAG: SPOR domain-containing protein [Erythrobacter sp.]|nr:MAG: SPOR domain-containing protein [Erythrobacter sp.]
MRLPDDVRPAAFGRGLLTLSVVAGLSACGTLGGGSGGSDLASASSAPTPIGQRANAPRADYPATVGDPYFVGEVEYVPSDTLNYDHVGYLAVDAGAMGYSGAHHTLPVPSYVEVTSLESGRTVLVRLERRGPMDSNHLLALSPAALAQLGATAETPVRVRRVNPPEEHRYLLRAGEPAPLRMDTPASLLTVLQRRLPASGAAPLQPAAPAPLAEPDSGIETIELAASEAAQSPAPVVEPAPAAATVAANRALPPELPALDGTSEAEVIAPSVAVAPVAEGSFHVQAASFSTMERAEAAAETLGGSVSPSGRYFRVRTGPFTTRGEAEASLANVRRAGYSDARILTSG